MPRKSIEEEIDERRSGVAAREPQERERPSWRDLDRKRDSSRHSDQAGQDRPAPTADRYATAAAQKALMGELQDLFRNPAHDALRQALLAADRAGLDAALDALIEARGGLPDDVEVLDKAMDTRKDRTLRLVLDAVERVLPGADEAARKLLLGRVRTKGRRSFDAQVSRKSKDLLARWGIDD